MTRTVNVDMEIKAKKITTAINKFFDKHSELNHWRELVEYMFDNNIECYNDSLMADGTYNKDWCYSICAECSCEGHYYISIVERS